MTNTPEPEFPDFSDETDLPEFEVSVTNTFHAGSAEEAVAQMIEWLQENAAGTGYRIRQYDDDGDGSPTFEEFIDGDHLGVPVSATEAAAWAPPYRCPDCGDTEYLEVCVKAWMTLVQKPGAEFVETVPSDSCGDHDWDEISIAVCGNCHWVGVVADLTPEEVP